MNKLNAFVNRVQSDNALSEKLANTQWDTAAALKTAEELGFKLTSDELQAAIDTLSGDLSHDILKHIAGGDPNWP